MAFRSSFTRVATGSWSFSQGQICWVAARLPVAGRRTGRRWRAAPGPMPEPGRIPEPWPETWPGPGLRPGLSWRRVTVATVATPRRARATTRVSPKVRRPGPAGLGRWLGWRLAGLLGWRLAGLLGWRLAGLLGWRLAGLLAGLAGLLGWAAPVRLRGRQTI